MKRMRKQFAVISMAIAMGAFTHADAQILNVQFGSATGQTFSGSAADPNSGSFWNSIFDNSPIESTVLSDYSDGTTPAAGITVTRAADGMSNLGGGGLGSTGPYANLMNTYIVSASSDTSTITLTGLTPDASFNIYLYADTGSYSGALRPDLFTLGALNGGGTGNTTGRLGDTSTLVEGTDYTVIAGHVDASGDLAISWQGLGTEKEGDLNGFQIDFTTVPEPATWAMMLGGFAFLLSVLRLRRQA